MQDGVVVSEEKMKKVASCKLQVASKEIKYKEKKCKKNNGLRNSRL